MHNSIIQLSNLQFNFTNKELIKNKELFKENYKLYKELMIEYLTDLYTPNEQMIIHPIFKYNIALFCKIKFDKYKGKMYINDYFSDINYCKIKGIVESEYTSECIKIYRAMGLDTIEICKLYNDYNSIEINNCYYIIHKNDINLCVFYK
jgi:hypothetical protein